MWYVNDAIYNAWFTKVYGFILTMWYVNNYRKTDTFMALVKFYINYVICKFGLKSKNILNSPKVLY